MSQNLTARIDITATTGGVDTVRKLREELAKLTAAADKLESSKGLTSLGNLSSKMEALAAAAGKVSLATLVSDVKTLNPQLASMESHLSSLVGKLSQHKELITSVAGAYNKLNSTVASGGSKSAKTAAEVEEARVNSRAVVVAHMRAIEDAKKVAASSNRGKLNTWDALYADQNKAEAVAAANLKALRAQAKADAALARKQEIADLKADAKAKADVAAQALKAQRDNDREQARVNSRSVVKAQGSASAENNRRNLNKWDALYADQDKAEAKAAANLKALRAQTIADQKAADKQAVADARQVAKAKADAAKSAAKAQTDAAKAAAAQQRALDKQAIADAKAAAKARADAFRSFSTARNNVSTGLTGLSMAGVAGGYMARNQIQETVSAGITIQGTKASLLAATGDATKAEGAFNNLLGITQKWGISLEAVKDAYPKLLLAADSAGSALGRNQQETTAAANHVFEAIAKTSTALHLNKEQVNGVTKAFEQMLSKGTVSAEELRNQLGDRLAGTMPMAAKAINAKITELDNMLRQKMISSYQFTILMAEEMNKQFEAAAKSAAGQMQATFNKLENDLLVTRYKIGEAGLFDGLTQAAETLRQGFADPAAMKGLEDMGRSVGDLAKWVAEAVVEFAKFYGQHADAINTIVKWVAAIGAGAIGIKAITWVFGDFAKVLIGVGSMAGGAATAIGGILTAATATAGGITALVSAMAPFVALAAGLMATMKQVYDGVGFKAQKDAFNSVKKIDYTNVDELKAERDGLVSTRNNLNDSWVASANDKVAGTWLGKKLGMGDNSKARAELDARIKNADLAIARHFEGTAEATVRGVVEGTVDQSEAAMRLAAQTRGVVGAPKAKKARGGSGNPQSSVTAADMALNKQDLAAKRADLDYQLQQMQISYANYAAELKANKAKELALNTADLVKERLTAKTPQQREVIDKKLEQQRRAYDEEAKIVDRNLAANNKKLTDNERDLQIELMREKHDALGAANADVLKQYEDMKTLMLINGKTDGVKLIDELINVKQAKNNLDEIKRQVGLLGAQADNKEAAVQLQVAAGSLTALEAEKEILEITKQRAAAQIDLLNSMDMTNASAEQQAAHEAELLKYKTDLLAVTSTQRQLEDDISQAMANAVMSIDGSIKSVGNSLKGLLASVRASLNKLMADQLAQSLKNAAFGNRGAGGEKGWLSQAASWGIGAIGSYFGGTGTQQADIPTNMSAFNSVGDSLMNVGGQSYTSAPVQNFNWFVTATDANSFNNQNTANQSFRDARLATGG